MTGEKSEAYKESDRCPLKICPGEPRKFWMLRVRGTNEGDKFDVIELDCSSSTFTPTGRGFPIDEACQKRCGTFCFLPAPYNTLVLCDDFPNVLLLGLDCVSGAKLWEDKVQGGFLPAGASFFPQNQLLLVGDWKQHRVLVLDPSSGSHLQTLALPQEVGKQVLTVGLHNEQLFVLDGLREGGEEEMHTLELLRFSLT